jgi:hypothetical protein
MRTPPCEPHADAGGDPTRRSASLAGFLPWARLFGTKRTTASPVSPRTHACTFGVAPARRAREHVLCGALTDPATTSSRPQSTPRGELASLRLDTPFKRAFMDPESLAQLLNAVLNDTMEHSVQSINNVELKSRLYRGCIFDVYCTLSNGAKVIVELQRANMREQLVDRLVGYMSRAYGEQWRPSGVTEAGPSGYKLVPVKVVAIIDFTLEHDAVTSGALVQNFSMCSRSGTAPVAPSSLRRFQELLDVTIVQLPLAPKDASLPGLPAAALWAHLLRFSERYNMTTLPQALRAAPYAAVAASALVEALTEAERTALAVEEDELRNTMFVNESGDRLAAAADAEKARAEQAETRAEQAETRAKVLELRLQELLGAWQPPDAADTEDDAPAPRA